MSEPFAMTIHYVVIVMFINSIFLLLVFVTTLVMQAFFRMVAAAFKSAAPAQTIAGLAVLILTLYTGYLIPQPTMIGALRWITHISVSTSFGFRLHSSSANSNVQ